MGDCERRRLEELGGREERRDTGAESVIFGFGCGWIGVVVVGVVVRGDGWMTLGIKLRFSGKPGEDARSWVNE